MIVDLWNAHTAVVRATAFIGLSAGTWATLSDIATIIGGVAIAIGFATYGAERRKSRRDYYMTYDEGINTFFELCLDHADLPVMAPREEALVAATADRLGVTIHDTRRKWLLMVYLLSLLERVHLVLTSGPKKLGEEYERSWKEYVQHWSEDPIFLEVYRTTGGDFGVEFTQWMETLLGAPAGRLLDH
jgi:hypothetical protein